MKFDLLISICLISFLTSCNGQVNTNANEPFQVSHPEKFSKYWYGGEGEISTYNIEQIRYGESRSGQVVMVYVSENFLPEKQVKREFGDKKGITILKLNKINRFVTGIYDYSIMTSVFTPVKFREYPATLKVTCSSQDWCGQSFSQYNLRNRMLEFQQNSYFQSEGDIRKEINATYTEDDVWTRIRIEPQMLPLGEIEMVPSFEYLRLKHKEFKAYEAIANLVLQVNANQEEFYLYTLEYPELDRKLTIKCQASFPFKILSWEEKWNTDNPNQEETTTAEIEKTIQVPYWELNGSDNVNFRDSLNIRLKEY